jgi:transposase
MSLCDFLEGQCFDVLMIDPRTLARNLKKKTDVCDAAWLQELHAFGLLKSCFRPAEEVRALRALWRHRDHLVTEAARLLQMMQKVLVQMNVHLHLVVADVAGATGITIVRAIAQGQRDPTGRAGLTQQ